MDKQGLAEAIYAIVGPDSPDEPGNERTSIKLRNSDWRLIESLLRSTGTGRSEAEAKELRHYAERVGFAGDMGVVDREFGFVRCVLPYDYRYTSNSQQHDEAEKICRALEGPMQALGVASIRPAALNPPAREGEGA